MDSQLPSQLITQWTTRFENHKKKIASEEKITEMKLGGNITYYIQHAAENSLSSSDKRRFTLNQYKNFIRLINHINKEEKIEEVTQLLEHLKSSFAELPKKSSNHSSLHKTKQLLNEFQSELNTILVQKKSQPSNEIKR
jgi:hypothetical protein